MGLDSLLVLVLGLNRAQLAAVRLMGIENQISAEESSREGKLWSDMEDISRLGNSLKGLPILNKSMNIIANIGNCTDPGYILEDLRIAPHESWSYMDQYEMNFLMELFIQWFLGLTSPVLFSFSKTKWPVVRILHSETKYEGGVEVEYHHAGEVVAFVREHKERRDLTPVLINPGKS